MNRIEELSREVEALRARLSKLSEASLRINQSLDVDVVLQSILDNARLLTGARYGVFTLLEDTGEIQGALSSGLTAEESERLWAMPEGRRFFDHLSRTDAPLRLSDLFEYMRSEDMPAFRPPLPVQAKLPLLRAPVLYQGEHMGDIHVAQKDEGKEFSSEDEETLVMFASQAAMVIANARRYRKEQRARTDLENLIHISPIGVVVFDVKSGAPLSFNREARRIAEQVGTPGGPAEQALEVATFHMADGQQISLLEISLAEALRATGPLRAEEVIVEAPDGRSITLLVNTAHVRSEEGEVVALIVTLQDMTPLQEMERLRVEFLAMVSHELRTPLTSIKGSIATLLNSSATLDPAESLQFHRIIDTQAERMRELIKDLLDVARIETGTLSVSPGPIDVAILVDEARNTFRSGGNSHQLQIELAPDLPWVMADKVRITQVLNNLLTNAARHSPATSVIQVSVKRDGLQVELSVSDEGRGVSAERLPYLFRRFARVASDEVGSVPEKPGLGLAISKGIVEAHGGRIWAESDGLGMGAKFSFSVPVFVEENDSGEAQDLRDPAHASEAIPSNELRILVVDDDPQTLRYVRSMLANAGYKVTVTGDPEEALQLAAEVRPHLALLDLMLPGTDGIELMTKVLETADMPVIFLSAYGQEDVVARAFDMGASDYIIKPFSPTELLARIRATLRTWAASEPRALAEHRIDDAE